MEQRLAQCLAGSDTPVATLRRLVDLVRPGDGRDESAGLRLRALIHALEARPDLAGALAGRIDDLLANRRAVLLFATAGIYPETGVLTESLRRLGHKLLPEAVDDGQLKDAFAQIFRRRDAGWLAAIPEADWARLLCVLRSAWPADGAGLVRLREDLREALRVVAHRIAAAGLDPELLRLDPALEAHASPFLAQCEEALALANRLESAQDPADIRHLLVLLGQVRDTGERVRRRARQQGASFQLTFRLRRLAQHLRRLEQLTRLAGAWQVVDHPDDPACAIELWRDLLLAECRRNDLRCFWRANAELVALRVTENAGRSGEHYITETRSEYLAMLRSAALGGVVIAMMAAHKLVLSHHGLAPLAEVLAYCLNYGLGFVLIHLLHGTVATKQPAMTANAIAAAIGEAEEGGRERARDLAPLVTLIARTVRTQLAAILGNVGIAVPVAILCGLGLTALGGQPFVSPEKARLLLADSHPWQSGAVLFAAVAGVCLFLAGLIAGYYDNLCAYNRIPARIDQLAWGRRMFGPARWRRVADYVGDNLGALAGNFFFGFMLGGAAGLGSLLGLPLDIRHIAFSSAYWGYALVGLDFAPAYSLLVPAALGIALIGLTNLAVSFYLALAVALRARGVDFRQRLALWQALGRAFLEQPRSFLLPPRAEPKAATGEAANTLR